MKNPNPHRCRNLCGK